MIDNDTQTIDRKIEAFPLTNVVVLKKGLYGVVQANPVAYVHLTGSTTCFQGNPQELKTEYCEPPQIIEEAVGPRVVKRESIAKRFVRVISILLTVGGALIIVKHNRFTGLTNKWKSKYNG